MCRWRGRDLNWQEEGRGGEGKGGADTVVCAEFTEEVKVCRGGGDRCEGSADVRCVSTLLLVAELSGSMGQIFFNPFTKTHTHNQIHVVVSKECIALCPYYVRS